MLFSIYKTETFNSWLSELRDASARHRIQARIIRLQLGNAGDVKPVGEGVSELRVDYGPGYRVYYKQHDRQVVILLCGGDKSTQQKDISKAKELAQGWSPT